MNEILVLGDGAQAPANSAPTASTVALRISGNNPNIRLQINALRTKFLKDLPARLEDLIRIASYVYSADTRVSRGSDTDVFGERWCRRFRMVLPVWDLEFWSDSLVLESLAETLNFLTGDDFEFNFTKNSDRTLKQRMIEFEDPEGKAGDVVIPFSGGADSLSAVLLALKENKRPVLVSHRAAPKIDKRQKDLVELLRQSYPQWRFPHISLWVNRTTGRRGVEFTQRSRSFLFTSLAVVSAAMLDIDHVHLCDNGVVSINLPQSNQNVGTFLSRSTHPRFLWLAERLMRLITLQSEISLSNSLLFKTKKEVLAIIRESGHPDLLQETVSCAHVEGTTKFQPHCGVCSQCIDRRFASVASGLSEHDLASGYRTDIFLDNLEEGQDRTHAENYVRFAASLEDLPSSDAFFETYPQLFDALPPQGDAEAFADSLWQLFQRHQTSVNSVLDQQIELHVKELRRGTLPENCLLRIVAAGQQKRDPRIKYVERLRDLICKSLPPSFQTHKAKNEKHVQDCCQSVFIAAQEFLRRESPQLPFSLVTTKPDFSELQNHSTPLFVEFKFVKERKRLNGIVTEMTSRITIYKHQGAWILFIVYDPNRSVVDDEAFKADFEDGEVWVGMAR